MTKVTGFLGNPHQREKIYQAIPEVPSVLMYLIYAILIPSLRIFIAAFTSLSSLLLQ